MARGSRGAQCFKHIRSGARGHRGVGQLAIEYHRKRCALGSLSARPHTAQAWIIGLTKQFAVGFARSKAPAASERDLCPGLISQAPRSFTELRSKKQQKLLEIVAPDGAGSVRSPHGGYEGRLHFLVSDAARFCHCVRRYRLVMGSIQQSELLAREPGTLNQIDNSS